MLVVYYVGIRSQFICQLRAAPPIYIRSFLFADFYYAMESVDIDIDIRSLCTDDK